MKKTIQRALIAVRVPRGVRRPLADGIAFLTNLKGEVAVDGAKPQILSELARGQKLTLAKDAQASVMYIASGKEYALRGPGDYVVKETEVSASSGVPPLTRTTEWRASNKVLGQVAQTSAASVRMRSIAPPKGSAQLLYPDARQRRHPAADVPLGHAGPDRSHALRGRAMRSRCTAARPTATRIAFPPSSSPTPSTCGSSAPARTSSAPGKFRTLPLEAIQQVEKRKPSDRAEFSDRLLYALMLQELGAVQEAQELWSKLAKERTDLPELAGLAK